MSFQIARVISRTCFVLAFLAAFVLYIVPQQYANLTIGAFALFAAIGFLALFAFYRCPHCKKRFPIKKPVGSTCCPHCGRDLGAKI